MSKSLRTLLLILSFLVLPVGIATAAEYKIDTDGAHAFVQFRVKHLGYSWLYGRFDRFSGDFYYDPNQPQKSRIMVEIDTNSVNSNHAERDRHIRSDKFLDVEKFPMARFVSKVYQVTGKDTATLTGDLTLHGVTKPVTLQVQYIGGGADPWGGYRQGFEGRTTIKPNDFGIAMVEQLGAASGEVELMLSVEGIQQSPRKNPPGK